MPGTASNLGVDSAPACPSQWAADWIQDHGESIDRALVSGRVAVTEMGERICARERRNGGLEAERRREKPPSRGRFSGPRGRALATVAIGIGS